MPFTFTTEDGTGRTDANAYLSVTEADDILTMNIHAATAWNNLAQDVKEKLLAWGSRFLDERVRWNGRKAVETSALRWPRTGNRDRDGIPIAADEIPDQVKVATATMARALLDNDRTTERDQDGLRRLKADVVELEFIEGYRLPAVPDHLKYIISGIGNVNRIKKVIR